MSKAVSLPALTSSGLSSLDDITKSLGVPRTVIAAADDISKAWAELPNLLQDIPAEYRNEFLARMCIAVNVGLFDSSINYIWNLAISSIKNKILHFGVGVAASVLNKEIDEKWIDNCQDSELLNLALALNIIDEDGFYKLDHCRDMRNNFSAAHPAIGSISVYELFAFVERCVKYALSNQNMPRGVDVKEFIGALKTSRFNPEQVKVWSARLIETNVSQRGSIVGMLHGMYCDEALAEESRNNILTILKAIEDQIPAAARASVVSQHQSYVATGKQGKVKASYVFVEQLALLQYLPDSELHTLISSVCESLYTVHLGMNNFYNEAPFARRLCEIVSVSKVPSITKSVFVETVMTCAIGNEYGTAFSAEGYYVKIIKNFSPAEIELSLEMATDAKGNRVGRRVSLHPRCRVKLKEYLRLLDPKSLSPRAEALLKKVMAG